MNDVGYTCRASQQRFEREHVICDSNCVLVTLFQQGSQETFHLGDYLIYPTDVFVTEWLGITPEEAGLKEDTWPMPDGSSIVGVKIADHGRRPLPDGVIKVSRDFRKTVGIEKKTHEDCIRL